MNWKIILREIGLFTLFSTMLLFITNKLHIVDGQLELCQSNCVSSDRLTGPTRMENTKTHPWKVAQYPSSNGGFCKLGCQIFYTETPKNTTCKNLCGYFYRSKISVEYSDLTEEARLECEDGCDIALQVSFLICSA